MGRRYRGAEVWQVVVVAGLTLAASSAPAPSEAQTRHPTVLAPAAIDWASVAGKVDPDATARRNQMPGFLSQRRALDATTLPVILPAAGSGISLRQMTFSSFGDAYGMALPQEQSAADVTIVITATRSFVDADPGTLHPSDFETINIGGTSVPATFEDTESGWTASFPLYGALYSIDVDCGQQDAGSPCADSGYVRRLVSSFSSVTVGRTGQAAIDALNPQPPEDDGDNDWRRVSADPADLEPEDRYSDRRWWDEVRPDCEREDGCRPNREPEPRPEPKPEPKPEPPKPEPPRPVPQPDPVVNPPNGNPATPPRDAPRTPAKTDKLSNDPVADFLLRQLRRIAPAKTAVSA